MGKRIIKEYTFDASEKTISFDEFSTIYLESILLVTNVTDNIIIYDFQNPNKKGTVSTNVLALQYDTTGMDDSDSIQIHYDDGFCNRDINIHADYKSPYNFTATYSSANTITLSNLDFSIIDSSQIVGIKVIPASGNSFIYKNGIDGITIRVSSNVISLHGYPYVSPFNSGDVYEVGINALPFEKDPSTQSIKTSTLNNVWNQYTDVETLVTAQDLTSSYANFGSEIDMRGYNRLGIYIITDVNDSENVDLNVLGKHTSGGTDLYNINGISTVSLWTTSASDDKNYYEFDIGTIPFIQLQAVAETVGATAGDLTIGIDKKWRN
jgi:hypothetical protein